MGAARSVKLAKEKLGNPGHFNPALQLLKQGVDVSSLGVHAVEASAGFFDAAALALDGQVATGAEYLLGHLFNLVHPRSRPCTWAAPPRLATTRAEGPCKQRATG